MSGAPLEAVLRRDRLIVLAALAAIACLAWLSIAWLGADPPMRGMPAGGVMDRAFAARLAPWSGTDFAMMFAMWAAMMVGMMTPSAAPMILLYARVGRQALSRGAPFAAAGWFASGYLLAWSGFAAAATLLQWALERAALLTSEMRSASPLMGGLLLIVAGLYQWTPLKQACLTQCQSPLLFIQRQGGFRGDRGGAVRLGLCHGLFCVGCCWGLMLLLFLGGVMNLLWIAALAALVLAEKALPSGRWLPRTTGMVLLLAGAALLLRSA